MLCKAAFHTQSDHSPVQTGHEHNTIYTTQKILSKTIHILHCRDNI